MRNNAALILTILFLLPAALASSPAGSTVTPPTVTFVGTPYEAEPGTWKFTWTVSGLKQSYHDSYSGDSESVACKGLGFISPLEDWDSMACSINDDTLTGEAYIKYDATKDWDCEGNPTLQRCQHNESDWSEGEYWWAECSGAAVEGSLFGTCSGTHEVCEDEQCNDWYEFPCVYVVLHGGMNGGCTDGEYAYLEATESISYYGCATLRVQQHYSYHDYPKSGSGYRTWSHHACAYSSPDQPAMEKATGIKPVECTQTNQGHLCINFY